MKTKIKTIDVTAYEWLDKVNGNSYFAGTITINFGMKGQQTINMPYQYGYGDQYRFEAFKLLQENGLILNQKSSTSEWVYYKENNIIARHTKHEDCKKAQLKRF